MNRDNHQSLQSRLEERVQEDPEARAIAFVEMTGEILWQTRAEFHSRAMLTAARLRRVGLAPGDVCVLMLSSDETCATTFASALLAGAIPVLVAAPVLRGMDGHQVRLAERVIRKTAAKVAVVEDGIRVPRVGSGCKVVTRGSLSSELVDVAEPWYPRSNDVAAMQLTSGTTGSPRICVWRQEAVLAALDGMTSAMALGSEDVCVNWTPLYHDMGLVNNFLLCMTSGVPLVMLKTLDFIKDPSLWLKTLSSSEATTTWSPNFGFALATNRVRTSDLQDLHLDRMRSFWNAAERIHHGTMRDFRNRFASIGVRAESLRTNFGCAENVGGATFSDPAGSFLVEHVDSRRLYEDGIAMPTAGPDAPHSVSIVGVGRPYPGMSITIRSPAGDPLAAGRIGEITLRTPSRFEEYLGEPTETRAAIQGDTVRTGDLGYLRDDELFWVGRTRERLNVRGRKLDPSDFEIALLSTDGLREGCFTVFGVDDAELGTQRVVIVSEVRRQASRPHAEIIRDVELRVGQELGVPVHEVLLLEEGSMTKTTSGKRRHLYYKDKYLNGGLSSRKPSERGGHHDRAGS